MTRQGRNSRMKKALKVAGIATIVCAGAAVVALVAKDIINYKRKLNEPDIEEEDDDYEDDEYLFEDDSFDDDAES